MAAVSCQGPSLEDSVSSFHQVCAGLLCGALLSANQGVQVCVQPTGGAFRSVLFSHFDVWLLGLLLFSVSACGARFQFLGRQRACSQQDALPLLIFCFKISSRWRKRREFLLDGMIT